VAVAADVEGESSLLISGATTASEILTIPRTAGTKIQRTFTGRLPVASALTMSKLSLMNWNAGTVVKQAIW
jgi:hypothetical protein